MAWHCHPLVAGDGPLLPVLVHMVARVEGGLGRVHIYGAGESRWSVSTRCGQAIPVAREHGGGQRVRGLGDEPPCGVATARQARGASDRCSCSRARAAHKHSAWTTSVAVAHAGAQRGRSNHRVGDQDELGRHDGCGRPRWPEQYIKLDGCRRCASSGGRGGVSHAPERGQRGPTTGQLMSRAVQQR
jgi:hypothetical protein